MLSVDLKSSRSRTAVLRISYAIPRSFRRDCRETGYFSIRRFFFRTFELKKNRLCFQLWSRFDHVDFLKEKQIWSSRIWGEFYDRQVYPQLDQRFPIRWSHSHPKWIVRGHNSILTYVWTEPFGFFWNKKNSWRYSKTRFGPDWGSGGNFCSVAQTIYSLYVTFRYFSKCQAWVTRGRFEFENQSSLSGENSVQLLNTKERDTFCAGRSLTEGDGSTRKSNDPRKSNGTARPTLRIVLQTNLEKQNRFSLPELMATTQVNFGFNREGINKVLPWRKI